MACQISHQVMQFLIFVILDHRAQAGYITQVLAQMLSPARTTLVGERGIERVGAIVDPLAQGIAVCRLKHGL